jgi:hypothetical protein
MRLFQPNRLNHSALFNKSHSRHTIQKAQKSNLNLSTTIQPKQKVQDKKSGVLETEN